MLGDKEDLDCFSTLSCRTADYYLCKHKDQCLEAAENLERMTRNIGEGEIPFSLFVEYRKERWGLSCMALRELRAAHEV